LGESRELVRAAVAIGVLDDADAVAALGLRSELVWIVDRLGDPKPATRVPIHADRLADLGLRDEERHLESVRDDEVLLRLRGLARNLHLRDRLALRSPASPGEIVRNRLRRLGAFEGLQVSAAREPVRDDAIVARRPADASLDERVESGLAEGAMVVAVRRVEDAPFP